MRSLLKHLREESGLGQAAFASTIGASQSYVSDIERGYRDMTPSFATKAAGGLGVDPVVLMCGFQFEQIARKAEEGDPDAAPEALALAKKLVDLLEEDLDEEQAAEVRAIVEQLLKLVEGKKPADEDGDAVAAAAKKANEGSLRWVEQKVMAQLNPPASQLGAIDAPGVRDYWFIRDVFPDTVVVESEQTGQILSYPYEIDGSGELVLDEPQEVRLDYAVKPKNQARLGKPATKASADGTMAILRRMGGMSRVGGFDEAEWYDRLIEVGIPAPALENLLDEISARHSSSLISDAERLSLEALQVATERRIAELTGDGARSSFQYLAGNDPRAGGGFQPYRSDIAAVKARRDEEARESREHTESMEALGLDMHGRVIPPARTAHERALKNSGFLSEDEKELGVDYRGLPLDERRLKSRRYVEEG